MVVLFLALLPTLLFGRSLWFGLTMAYDDLAYWFYPWKMLLRIMAQNHQLDFWLPCDYAGMPHLADIQRQLFYPLNVMFYLLPTRVAMVAFVGGHFFIASVLMYAFLRNLPLSEEMGVVPATCGAVVFAFSAFPLLHLTQLPVLASYVWIPGVLLALEHWWQRPSAVVAASGALGLCMMFLGGSPQVGFIGCCLCGAYGVLLAALAGARRLAASREDGSYGGSGGGLGGWSLQVLGMLVVPLLGIGLASLQLLPTAELGSYSSRKQEVPAAFSAMGTAEPRMMATLLSPYVLGNPRNGNYTGPAYSFHEACFYMGFLTLLLASGALGALPHNQSRVWFFGLASALGIIIALGNHLSLLGYGFHDLMRELLPGFGKFRVPPRWLILTVTGGSVLAAIGLNTMVRFRHRVPADVAEGVVAAARAALATAILNGVVASMVLFRLFEGRKDVLGEWTWMTILAAAAVTVLGLAWFGVIRSASMGGLLTLLLAVDLLSFGWRYVIFSPPPETGRGLDVLRDLASRPGPGRVVTHTDVAIPTQIATYASVFGVENVQGTNPLFLRPYFEYLYYSQAGDMPAESETGCMHRNGFFVMGPVQNNMTRLLNLRWRVVMDGIPPPGVDGTVGVPQVPVRVESLKKPFGEAMFVPGYRVVEGRRRMYEILRSPLFHPQEEVLFAEEPPARPVAGRDNVAPSVTISLRKADRIQARVVAPSDGFVLFSEVYFPGWSATVDGQESPLLQGDGIFRTVFVRRGTHDVTLRFVPGSFRTGLLISLLTALVLTMGLFLDRWLRRRLSRGGSSMQEEGPAPGLD